MAKVLIVDDSIYFRACLKRMLENLGHEVIGEASDGRSAVKIYEQIHPDIVTMDISMPGVSGIYGVKEIIERDPAATIIMVSAMGQKTYLLEAMSAGAKHFILKPFQEEMLEKVMNEVLED